MSLAFTVAAIVLTITLLMWAACPSSAETEAKARGPFFGLVVLFTAAAVVMRFLGA